MLVKNRLMNLKGLLLLHLRFYFYQIKTEKSNSLQILFILKNFEVLILKMYINNQLLIFSYK